MFRKAQIRLEDERRKARAERASAYLREWKRFRAERLRGDLQGPEQQ
jgi:hypothetical protein